MRTPKPFSWARRRSTVTCPWTCCISTKRTIPGPKWPLTSGGSGATISWPSGVSQRSRRLARRANALVLLDRGMSCEDVGRVLLIDDDTIRTWHRLFEEDGVDGLAGFNYRGRACQLTLEQQVTLKAWVGDTLPRTTRMVGAWIEHAFGVVYESRSGLIALLHRLGLEHRKPEAMSRKLDPAKQQAFIDAYETLLKTLPDDEAVLFADAVHPTHGTRPVGCWAPKEIKVAVDQAGTA